MQGFEATVERMLNYLVGEAQHRKVSLTGLNSSNFNWHLDQMFGDGGDVRCDFTQLSYPYAAQFGEFGGDRFDNASWRCIAEVIRRLRRASLCHDVK